MDACKVKLLTPIVIGVAVVLGSILYRKRRKNAPPDDWTEVGTLNDLMCFPIKSCGVIRVTSMNCSKLGLKSDHLIDRKFVVIEDSGNFITARKYPKLVLVKPTVENDTLVLEAPNMPTLKINIPSSNRGNDITVTVWEVPIKSKDCGDEAAEWFSKYILGTPTGLRLAMHPSIEGLRKGREPQYVHNNDTGLYPDETSYNLINESSIDDLNSKLNEKITPQQFRPNFVIKGAKPFEEDYWKWVKIGEVTFKAVRQCTRCVLTTIDPETGIKSTSGEPLKTLRTYRNIGDPKREEFPKNVPVMGIHLVLHKGGKVSLGDKVYVSK